MPPLSSVYRVPQSPQSVPRSQKLKSEPAPPSSQSPSLSKPQVSVHSAAPPEDVDDDDDDEAEEDEEDDDEEDDDDEALEDMEVDDAEDEEDVDGAPPEHRHVCAS